MKISRLKFGTILLAILVAEHFNLSYLNAQNIIIDPTFNASPGYSTGIIYSLLLQPDSKVVISGGFFTGNGAPHTHMARLNADGSDDISFNADTIFKNSVFTTALQTDGKILAGGLFNKTSFPPGPRNHLARLNSNGTLDNAFMLGTGFDNPVIKIAIQPDGKIIAGGIFSTFNGNSSPRIVRLDSNGDYDPTFIVGTGFNNDILSIAIQNNGKIIVGGRFTTYKGTACNRIVRLNSDGSIDPTFNIGTGFTTGAANDGVFAIQLQPDGKILAAGGFTTYNGSSLSGIVRINTDGSIDNSFNTGTGFNSIVYSLVIQNDGAIIASGTFSPYNSINATGIARLLPSGAFDNNFNTGLGLNNWTYTLLQPDGKIICGGNPSTYNGTTCNKILRLNNYYSPTSLDENEAENGFRIYPNPAKEELNIEFNDLKNIPLELQIFNEIGVLIRKETANTSNFKIPLDNFNKGIYFISVYEDRRLIKTLKFIKS